MKTDSTAKRTRALNSATAPEPAIRFKIHGQTPLQERIQWFASGIYTVSGLGSIETWERGQWDLVEPHVGLSGTNRIAGGTGALSGARGELQMDVYEHTGTMVSFIATGHLVLPPGTAK